PACRRKDRPRGISRGVASGQEAFVFPASRGAPAGEMILLARRSPRHNSHRTRRDCGRGRDASYPAPPAQIRTCGFPAYGSHLGYQRQHAAVRVPKTCVTLTRLGVRRVLTWPAFPSVPALFSTNSAADRSALFTGFTATLAR